MARGIALVLHGPINHRRVPHAVDRLSRRRQGESRYIPRSKHSLTRQIGLLYGGIFSEIVANIAIIFSTAHVQPPFERLSERYGAFTLIIL